MPRMQTTPFKFTKMFPLLVELCPIRIELSPSTWKTLSKHIHMKRLILHDIHINATEAHAFWKACEKLDVLKLVDVIVEGGRIPSDVVFPQVRILGLQDTMSLDTAAQFDLIYP
ncbi:MAG: hypothetical protein J3Q66DRAFT_367680 [Benniella sp.]|nr:MAG: hypothetical protein J3Q66DRAFT_367680 [Benniella sp.]